MILLTLLLVVHSAKCDVSKLEIVQENLEKIKQWNTEAGSSTKFAPNEFLAYTEEETNELLGIQEVDLNFPQHSARNKCKVGQGPPSSFDWRWFDAITTPRSSSVKSALLEAAVYTIESAYFRASGTLKEFSALEIEQCGEEDPSSDPAAAFEYIAKHKRLASLKGYGTPGACAAGSTENAMTDALVDGYSRIAADDYELINSMMRYPLLAAVRVSQKWAFYRSGVLDAASCPTGKPNHAVQIVAYSPTWYTARNSWGSRWGESGYIRLERGGGANPCGLLDLLIEPEVDSAE